MEKSQYPVVENATNSIKSRLDFGVEVRVFCARHGIRIKAFANEVGVKYYSLMDVMTGKSGGGDLIPKVREYMYSVDQSSHEQAVE